MLPIITLDSVTGRALGSEMYRPKRRAHKDRFTCSQQSILCAMDRFVKCVNNMDTTVLVPSKLQDMETVGQAGVDAAARVPSALASADLHSFYLMLNNVRKELLWGPGTVPQPSHGFVVREASRELKQCSRQCSEDSLRSESLGSTASSRTSSSSASDTDSEVDSLIIDHHTAHLSAAFRHHLQGLHSILHQLADSADYLCARYQEEVDSAA